MSNFKTIREPARNIPVIGEWDVVVCGGGPSGFIAAIAAARNGARTLLIHEHGFLGGMATAALVGPISKFNFNGERIVGGLPLEFIERMSAVNGAIIDLPSGNVPFDPEIYKLISIRMVRESGSAIRLHSKAVSCLLDENIAGKIDYVVVESASGREAVKSKFVIDATGTGSIVHQSRLPCRLRTDSDGRLQPMSLVFRLGGVKTNNLTVQMDRDGVKYANIELQKALKTEVDKGNLQQFGGPWTVFGSTIRHGEVSVNATRYPGNATDADNFTDAEIALREDVIKMVEIFKRSSPNFADCYLIDTATQAGIRETRMIEGLYTMSLEDILNPVNFTDTVAKGAHWIDIHQAQNSKQSATYVSAPYNICYRALVPQGSQNILVAGGAISATKEAFASIRVQAQCMALGQASGTAAALCVRQSLSVESLDSQILTETLKKQNVIL